MNDDGQNSKNVEQSAGELTHSRGEKHFSIKEAFSFGWRAFKRTPFLFLGVMLLFFILSAVAGLFLDFTITEDAVLLDLVHSLISYVIMLVFLLGLVTLSLGSYEDKEISFTYLFSKAHLFGTFFVSSVLFGFMVAIGLIFFVIPGLYLGARLLFFDFFVVDKGVGPVEALKLSWKATRGVDMKMVGFTVVLFLLFILIAAPLFVGSVVATFLFFVAPVVALFVLLGTLLLVVLLACVLTPFAFLAQVHVYKTLTDEGTSRLSSE